MGIFDWLCNGTTESLRKELAEVKIDDEINKQKVTELTGKNEDLLQHNEELQFQLNEEDALISELRKQIPKPCILENFWNTKRPQKNVYYSGRPLFNSNSNISLDVRVFINPNDNALPLVEGSMDDEKALNGLKWVINNISYVSDKTEWNITEFWQFSFETLQIVKGDCVAEYEEIITKEGVKQAKDIKIGDLVLSYDFEKQAFVFKSIVNVWNKGIKKVFRVHFRNGQSIDVTDEHNFLIRNNQKESIYVKQQLKDIDLSRWWKRKIPIAVKIPYEVKDINWLNEDLCLILGHYLAEGWKDKSHICSSGYELNDYIIPLLENNNIPFSEYINNTGVPCIRFLKSEFKEFLENQKESSFNIHLQEEILHLPENKLIKILEGIFIGDGHFSNYPDKRGFNSNKEIVYSTSSEQLSRDIQRIGLQLGKTYHIWKQENHKGVGKEPIYRITFNPESHFLKDYGYKDISEVSISHIEEIGECLTYDWEVKDTHNFVFKNGIITHNCEDGAILLYNILLRAGIPYWKMRLNAGNVKGGGHCWLTYLRESDNSWVVLDWCYWPDLTPVATRRKYKDMENYFDIWFSWNQKFAFNDTDYTGIISDKIIIEVVQ